MRSLILFTILILVFSNDVLSVRILGLFPHYGKSHQVVFNPLLRRLAEIGHEVTAATFYPLDNPPENYKAVRLDGIFKPRGEFIEASAFDCDNPILCVTGISRILSHINSIHQSVNFATNMCSKLVKYNPLLETLENEYDLVITENFNSDCMIGLLHVYGNKAPIIYMSSTALMYWTPSRLGIPDNPSYLPIVTSIFTTPMSFWQRFENTAINIYFKVWFRYSKQLEQKRIIEERFNREIPDLQELAKNVSLVLVNTHYSLNGVRPVVPAVVEVGGMHLDETKKIIPSYLERFLNESEHGVVLFSFGSLIKTSTLPKYKEEMIMKCLSELKQRVIWKYEDSGEEGTLVGNVLKVKWIPQYDLLQHPKIIAFVGHGGLLGMTEAISSGKPMFVIPFFGDQLLNGAQAEKVGFGKMIPYPDLTEEGFRDGLKSVLSAEMRVSARRASSIWKDRPADPLDTAVYWTERVIRWGHQAPLHSPARDLPLHQYLLLDVAAVVLIAFLILIAILRWFVILIIRFFSGSVTDKEKLH